MLKIVQYDINNNYRVLNNTGYLFHDALKYVLIGEKHFHVDNGDKPFDLIYIENDAYVKADPLFPNSDFFLSEMLFPPYFYYDENNIDKINLELLSGFNEIFFEEANEYTLTIGKLVSKYCRLKITYRDDNVLLFPWLVDKVKVNNKPLTDKYIYIQKDYYGVFTTPERYHTLDFFHSLFLLQWLTDLPKEKIKYLSLSIRKTEGIGSIISTYNRVSRALKKKGIITFIEPGCTRFSEEFLVKYFTFTKVPEDSNEENTIYAKSFNSFVLNHFIQQYEVKFNLAILNPIFLSQMKEYADYVIGNKKILGVLLRGTDYIIANYVGSYRPVSLEESIDFIKKEFKAQHYDEIFIATEDSSMLKEMIKTFPGKILTVSQERYSLTDFKDLKYISDLEKKLYKGKEYESYVEDTTVNYFYAMYLLSRCDSLISNCMCSGVDLATSFNNGKYKKNIILSDKIKIAQ